MSEVHRPRGLQDYLSIRQLAVKLDYVTTAPTDPEEACRAWIRRHRIRCVKRGRTLLVSPLDVERELRKVS